MIYLIFICWFVGREINYVYSYKCILGVVYGLYLKLEGVGFGGLDGKECLWLDDEFLIVIV